jgi:magnesium chelatase family protein
MWVDVPKLPLSALRSQSDVETSATVAARVAASRERQQRRNGEGTLNSRLPASALARACALGPGAERELQRCASAAGLSARGYHRALRVARTVADLEERDRVSEDEVLEAVAYRGDARAA